MNSVVICEKPSQARNVRDVIGNKYGTVLAARGHLFRLASPEEVNPEWKDWGYDVLRPASGFYPFVPDTSFGKDKVIGEFRSAIAKADRVIIATDCDRDDCYPQCSGGKVELCSPIGTRAARSSAENCECHAQPSRWQRSCTTRTQHPS